MNKITAIIAGVWWLFGLPAQAAVTVSTTSQLVSAINNTQHGGDKTILIEDGTYMLAGQYLRITAPGVSVRSASGDREKVTLDGGYQTTEIFQIVASNTTLASMTLKRAQDHAVHVMGGSGGDVNNTLMDRLHIIDPGEQAIKINPSNGYAAHWGTIKNSFIEMTASGRDFVEKDSSNGHPCYTGGIDAHGAKGWTVQDNDISGFWCTTGLSEHGIHFWSDSSDTLVQRNKVVDCDRGIGFGLGSSGHRGGIIRNNMITQLTNHNYSDVGIGLESAGGARVYNNSIYIGHNYPNAIEYRFADSQDIWIVNNLTNRTIRSRNGGTTSKLTNNVTHASSAWFQNVSKGDLHLQSERAEVSNAALFISGLNDDFDRQARPYGGGVDIGADEYMLVPGPAFRYAFVPAIILLILD